MKIAVYCRVSTDSEDQAHSFSSQQQYFREYIDRHPGWELYTIYADEGITGTSTRQRAAFRRMIEDAKARQFDRIITKEVSRFSRNMLDTITYTRQLKELGIGVFFVSDGIDTLEPDAELRLSIMGSLAQEESRRTSDRVKWGQTRRMEQGVVFGHSLLGYDLQGGKMTINPAGAKVVRLIFYKYVKEHKGTTVIARELEEAGYQTVTGRTRWRGTTILKILRNEKYCGDLKQKKTITPDYLTHRKQLNRGEEAFVFLQNHHEPIVSREIWEKAQKELAHRKLSCSSGQGRGQRYPLSGKIFCAVCGKNLVVRSRSRSDGTVYRAWRCATAVTEGGRHVNAAGQTTGCNLHCQINDILGLEMVRQAVKMLRLDTERILQPLINIIRDIVQLTWREDRLRAESLHQEQTTIVEKKKKVLDAFFAGQISREDMRLMNGIYDSRLAAIRQDLVILQGEIDAISISNNQKLKEVEDCLISIVCRGDAPDRFYLSLLDRMTVYPDKKVELTLRSLPLCWTYRLLSGQKLKQE